MFFAKVYLLTNYHSVAQCTLAHNTKSLLLRMSLSTWLFGKKKSPTSPVESSETDVSFVPESEEFVIVERKADPGYPSGNNPNMYPQLPYSLGPGQRQAPNLPTILQRGNSVDSSIHQNVLRDVPFRLSPELAREKEDHLQEIRMRSNDIMYRISQVNLKSYDYNFSVEQSVVLETEYKSN